MKCLRTPSLIFSILATVWTLAGPAARIVAQDSKPDYRLGTESFRYLFKKSGFTALTSFEDLIDPAHQIVVILGDGKPLDMVPKGLRNFISRGGAVLFASDQTVVDGALWEEFGVGVTGEHGQTQSGDLDSAYRGLADCPLVQPEEDAKVDLFNDLRRGLATNVPSRLVVTSNDRRFIFVRPRNIRNRLASFAEDCVFSSPPGNRIPSELTAIPGGLFAWGGAVNKGRILVLADHSVFINNMLQLSDNANREFALRCVMWLKGEDGSHDQVLFVDDGQIKSLNVELKRLPLAPPPTKLDMAQAVNQILANAEREDVFDSLLSNIIPPHWHRPTLRLLFFTIVLLGLGLFTLTLTRYRRHSTIPILDDAVDLHNSGDAISRQREDAVLKSQNWWEAGRVMVRRFFEEGQSRQANKPVAPPRWNGPGGLVERWRMRRLISRLWALAYGESPRRVTPRMFRNLQRDLERLKVEKDRGRLTVLSVNSLLKPNSPCPAIAGPVARPGKSARERS